MAANLQNYPVVNVINILVDFLRYIFTQTGLTPTDWRYNDDDKKTRILIRGGFGAMDEIPGMIPEIVVVRNTFGFSNSLMNNLGQADANTFSNVQKIDWMVGSVDVICCSRSQNEADCLASFVSLMIHEHRHQIIQLSQFIKQISYSSMGPATPGEQQDVEMRRWLTTVRFNVELKMKWVSVEPDEVQFDQIDLYTRQNGNAYEMEAGTIDAGSAYLVDETADFGLEFTNGQQLNEVELQQGWYYVFFGDLTTRFKIKSIIDNHTLHLVYSDHQTDTDVDLEEASTEPYKIVWNQAHFATTLETTVA